MSVQPDIVVSPEARHWLARHGNEVTLRPSPRHGCCGGTAAVPVAEIRRPDRPHDFDTVEIQGVRLHLARDLALAGTVELRLESLLGFVRLFVESSLPAENAARAEQESDDV